MHTRVRLLLALFLVGALTVTWLGSGRAASHREAPLMALDPAADITDVYAFVSYDDAIAFCRANKLSAMEMVVHADDKSEYTIPMQRRHLTRA